jgi:hypothetical protein
MIENDGLKKSRFTDEQIISFIKQDDSRLPLADWQWISVLEGKYVTRVLDRAAVYRQRSLRKP